MPETGATAYSTAHFESSMSDIPATNQTLNPISKIELEHPPSELTELWTTRVLHLKFDTLRKKGEPYFLSLKQRSGRHW